MSKRSYSDREKTKRRLLKILAASGSAIAIPSTWIRPVTSTAIIPAHAVGTGTPECMNTTEGSMSFNIPRGAEPDDFTVPGGVCQLSYSVRGAQGGGGGGSWSGAPGALDGTDGSMGTESGGTFSVTAGQVLSVTVGGGGVSGAGGQDAESGGAGPGGSGDALTGGGFVGSIGEPTNTGAGGGGGGGGHSRVFEGATEYALAQGGAGGAGGDNEANTTGSNFGGAGGPDGTGVFLTGNDNGAGGEAGETPRPDGEDGARGFVILSW